MTKVINEEYVFNISPRFLALPVENLGLLVGTKPSVKGSRVFKTSGSVLTVTNFIDGSDQQTIRILGDGNMTVSHNSNIKTNTAADKLLAVNKIYVFTLISNVWIEDA